VVYIALHYAAANEKNWPQPYQAGLRYVLTVSLRFSVPPLWRITLLARSEESELFNFFARVSSTNTCTLDHLLRS